MPRTPLLLDVDGVINVTPSVGVHPRFPVDVHRVVSQSGDTFTVQIRAELPGWLAELAGSFEIVWCTDWANANQAISPLVGLPGDLDQVPFPDQWQDVPLHGCRKTAWVRRWAAGRGHGRLAWVDDDLEGDADHRILTSDWADPTLTPRWARDLAGTPPVPGPNLLRAIRPETGLGRADIDHLLAFARNVTLPEWPRLGSPGTPGQ